MRRSTRKCSGAQVFSRGLLGAICSIVTIVGSIVTIGWGATRPGFALAGARPQTFHEAALELAARQGEAVPQLEQELDALATEITDSGTPLEEWFFAEARFAGARVATDGEAPTLTGVLEARRGPCLALAAVYLSLAERLGVQAIPVATPRHVFIRQTTSGQTRNIELLEGGVNKPDTAYLAQEKAPPKDPLSATLLRELTPRQFLAYLLNNRGVHLRAAGNAAAAEKTYKEALRLDSECQPCHYNYGNLLAVEGQQKKALRHYNAALDLHPWDEEARGNRESVEQTQ